MLMADKTQLEAIQNETQKGKKKKKTKKINRASIDCQNT